MLSNINLRFFCFAKTSLLKRSCAKSLTKGVYLAKSTDKQYHYILVGLSKNFSFWTVSLDLDATFKIKSLLYKDLILNSTGMSRK